MREDQKQGNTIRSYGTSKISVRSIPRVTKIKRYRRQHHSLNNERHIQSNEPVRDASIAHVTLRSLKKDKNLDVSESHQHSQGQNLSKPQNPQQGSEITIDPATKLKLNNNWDNGNSKKNIKSTGEDSYQHSLINKCSSNKTGHSTILNETKTRKRSKKKFCCSCSIPCVLLSLLIAFLLAGGIAAGIVGGVLSSVKTKDTSTTLTTTSVVSAICTCLCANEIWTFSSDLLARWSFDGTFSDVMNTYNAVAINNPSFVTDGYVNQALFFNASFVQSLSTPYIPLMNISFTIEAWLKPTLFPNPIDHSILGLCPSATSNQCLQLLIRQISSNYYLYFGFFTDNCQGTTSLSLNQWIHVAFVFDITTLTQYIYLNGILDNSCQASAPFMATVGQITIGTIPAIIPVNYMNFYQGYMDHISITRRAKPSCEILEDATLAACFTFDDPNAYVDSGPNSLLNTQISTSIVSSGHSHEAISFNGTAYLQASSFTGIGISNKPFSIILWIRPRSVNRTIVHVSQSANGLGWCIPFVGITDNGSIAVQLYNSGTLPVVLGPQIPMSPIWSHIVQTWSPINGLRLYIDNVLEASLPSATIYTASGASNLITLANSLSGVSNCYGGGLGTHPPGPFDGDIDDFRVYSRELTASDVYTIYYSR